MVFIRIKDLLKIIFIFFIFYVFKKIFIYGCVGPQLQHSVFCLVVEVTH